MYLLGAILYSGDVICIHNLQWAVISSGELGVHCLHSLWHLNSYTL